MAGPWLSAPDARRATVTACLLLSSLSGCSGEAVNLGWSGTMLGGGDAGSAGSAGSAGASSQGGTESLGWQSAQVLLAHPTGTFISFINGTFTATEPEQVYFTEQNRSEPLSFIKRAEQSDRAWSQRSSLTFDGEIVNDASNPAISLQGNQLWFGSRRGDSSNTDIWLCTGSVDTWSVPQKVDALNSDFDDAPRPPAVNGSIMPLSSKRHGGKYHQIYFAQRGSVDEPWQEPNQALLGSINSPAYESGDGFLTENGLTLFFASTRDGKSDLFRAERTSVDEPFGDPVSLSGVNSPDFDDRDPWLRERDQQLYFSSNRSGVYEIYRAQPAP